MADKEKKILLRNVPDSTIEKINQKKIEILKENPLRGHVSNTEAIVKLIEGK